MAEGLQDMDAAISPDSKLASIFTAGMLTTEQVAELLGVPKRFLAVYRDSGVYGPPFVALKKGRIGYPPEGVKQFLRERERRKQEKENPHRPARKRRICC